MLDVRERAPWGFRPRLNQSVTRPVWPQLSGDDGRHQNQHSSRALAWTRQGCVFRGLES